jgi:response regulator of citrate/malate metabolism
MIDVVVVDDDVAVARIHQRYVEDVPGFNVAAVAHSGAAALQAVREVRPHLVLLDIYLPDLNGLDLLRRLRDEAPDVDVLVISAAREAETVRRALHGGIVHYLIKPFSQIDLRERLEHYRSAHLTLAGSDLAEQADVDRIFGRRAGTERTVPKGLSPETERLVENAVRDAGDDLSATECAARVGISRVSSRRYLEHLVETGRVRVRLRYGEVGRPERRYAWQNKRGSRSDD